MYDDRQNGDHRKIPKFGAARCFCNKKIEGSNKAAQYLNRK